MSDLSATLSHYHPLKKENKMHKVENLNQDGKQICTLEIVIDGTPYYYEAHSVNRVAEIIAGQMETLKSLNEQYNSDKRIDNFTIHYFA